MGKQAKIKAERRRIRKIKTEAPPTLGVAVKEEIKAGDIFGKP